MAGVRNGRACEGRARARAPAGNEDIAEGVTWHDPERVDEWMGELSKEAPVVVYCAYGFHVGCLTAIVLRDAGFDARYMKVGHSCWKVVGAPVTMTA